MTNETTENSEFEGELRIYNPATMNAEGVRGKIFEGEYVGYFEEKRAHGTTGKPFVSKSHRFRDANGDLIILNSSGLFDWLIKNKKVSAGDVCSVTYKGKDKKDMHRFELEVREEEVEN